MTLTIRHVPDCYAADGIAVFWRGRRSAEGPENHSDSDDEERINMNNITIPWPDWTIVREIGRGGFGTVYEISRKDQCGSEEKAALKVISIPNEAEAINQFRMDGYDDASISARLKEDARKIQQEYYLQNQMKGHPNIVRVDENMVTAHSDGLGWDIFIRMELLHPMMEVLMTKQDFSEKEIIKIGKDICDALKVCHKRDIIHRDIKPDNIFLSDTGVWKLGDFGIARTMEHTTSATKAGTYNYLAPEVYHGEKYGKQVDIYSLGMVLYWLLNKRRRPFLPVDRPPTASEDEQARIKRFRGDPLPAPVNGSEGLKRIVLKACAYHPKERYLSPEEMYMELQAVESGAYQGNASAAAGKDEYDSFVVLESAYEENGISAGYGNGSHGNGSDASAGNRTAGAFGYGSAASVGNGSASGSMSSAGEGVSMGNGWEKDGTETIGNPHRPKGGRNKNDFLENTGKTERSVEINNIEKNEGDSKDKSGSKTTSNNPCPVGRLLAGEGLLIGAFFLASNLFSDSSLNLTNDLLITAVTFLLYFGGPILTILFWKSEGGLLSFSKGLIYVNIFLGFCTYAILALVTFVNSDNPIIMLLGCIWWVIGIIVSLYLGKWMLDEK